MKKTLIILVLSTLILFSCGKEETPVNQDIQENGNTVDDSNTSWEDKKGDEFTWTMEEVFLKWWKYTCTVSSETEWMKMSWTIHIDWKKSKSTIVTEAAWVETENNSLVLDGYTYIWVTGTKKWTKIKINEDYDDDESNMDDTESEWEEEIDDIMNFSCKKWVQEINFEIPSDIEFTEFDEKEMMGDMFGEWFEMPEGEMPEGFEFPEGFELPEGEMPEGFEMPITQ